MPELALAALLVFGVPWGLRVNTSRGRATSHDATAPGQALAVPPAPRIRVRRALDGNLDSYAPFRDWYGEEASWRCWFAARVDVSGKNAAFVLELFRRGIIPGFDGSLLDDGEWVFVANPCEWNEDDYFTMRQIDYWHGVVGDQPMCQMRGHGNDGGGEDGERQQEASACCRCVVRL